MKFDGNFWHEIGNPNNLVNNGNSYFQKSITIGFNKGTNLYYSSAYSSGLWDSGLNCGGYGRLPYLSETTASRGDGIPSYGGYNWAKEAGIRTNGIDTGYMEWKLCFLQVL
ncbi:hypothetical protein [Aliarcobacter butzleri]|uniref:hypothetical protein n=1 Tax=Aliarcobacter butzleri TaxID=28197 RepID=UPI002B24FDE5|nr:hypothetical protein [Aliarcobacter butzleri]